MTRTRGGDGRRQERAERAAFAFGRIDVDRAAVHLDDRLREVEPETGTADAERTRVLRTRETAEQLRLIGFGIPMP